MAFRKTSDCPIKKVFCRCGQELKNEVEKCPKCGKTLKSKAPTTKPAKNVN